jgi:hypothetical protein
MSILATQAESCLRQALEAQYGIQVLILQDNGGVVTPALRAKQILYRFRREIGDIELNKITIRSCPSDPDHRLWLIKQMPTAQSHDLNFDADT